MTKAKRLLFLYQQQETTYSNVGTYEWNGEENLPPQFVLSYTYDAVCALKKGLGDDGKYYYYVDQNRIYGSGSIQLHKSIKVPKTGITEVSSVIEILNVGTDAKKWVQVDGFVNSSRQYALVINANAYFTSGVAGVPPLAIGEHSFKLVISHSKNTLDVYIDDVKYGTSVSQYNAQTSPSPTCLCSLWSLSYNNARIKAFRYSHTD